MPADAAAAGGGTAADGALHGLVVGESEVFDEAEYRAYRLLAGPSVARHGGAALWSGGRLEVLEGSRGWQRQTGLVFASMAAARAWHASPEYQHAREQRRRGTHTSIWMIEQTGRPAPIAPGSGPAPLAYILGEVTEIRDLEPFKEYLRGVAPSLATVGGRYLTKGGRIDPVEGPWQPTRAVLIEFPSWDVAAAWYRSDAYQPLARLRQGCSDTELVLFEGVRPTA